MSGQVHWLPFAILLVAIAPVLAFWVLGRKDSKHYLLEQHTVRCRGHHNQLVNVTLVRDAVTHDPIGIQQCSAYSPPDDLRCNKECLPQFVHIKTAA
jgi:hypothetical protein